MAYSATGMQALFPIYMARSVQPNESRDAYDSAVADPATQARVEQDQQDGISLGVQGTPTFFLDGELMQPESAEDFQAQIDAAVNG